MTRQASRLLIAILLVLAAAVAAAQEIDPRARELLEGISGAPQELHTLQATTVTKIYGDDGAWTHTMHMIVDFDNRRLVATLEMMGIETTIRVVAGKTSMVMMGSEVPAPPEAGDQFEAVFDQAWTVDLFESAVRVTFDGPVDYGGVLVGDQVTYEGDVVIPNVPVAEVIRYVFTADGALLGTYLETEVGEMLVIFDEPAREMTMPTMSMTAYALRDDQWELASKIRYENVIINGEVEESLFQ